MLSLEARRGLQVSAETVRRWLHQLGWRWKRAKLVAPAKDPRRASKLAHIRRIWESLRSREALLFADELDLSLLPKSGYQWMPQGTQVEVMTPGKNQKHYLAGPGIVVPESCTTAVGRAKPTSYSGICSMS